MAQDERDIFPLAEVCQPVPGEHAFGRYHDVLTEGGDGGKKGFGIGIHVPVFPDLSFLVEDADIHFFRVQVDSTIKFVLFGVKLHKASSLSGGFVVPLKPDFTMLGGRP
jgi:hypothetical protein